VYDALIEIASTGDQMAQRIEKELHEQIARLKDDQQRRLLEFARSLADSPGKGAGGKALLRFAGTIERDEIVAIETAIDDGCETVNANEW
jgi:hypothetical protein